MAQDAVVSVGRPSVGDMIAILVPGFWLDASSWNGVAAALREAGHDPRPLTLPGLESAGADRSGIGFQDHVDAVVAAIDRAPSDAGAVALVGQSGGGALIYAAADARTSRIARLVFVDSGPLGEGGVINDELPVVGNEVPLPDWNVFEDADLVDLDDELRRMFRERAIPEPVGVTRDPVGPLTDDRRLGIPTTVVCCEFPSAAVREMIAGGHPFTQELARMTAVTLVDLPTGHWPQFTRPSDLGDTLVAALA